MSGVEATEQGAPPPTPDLAAVGVSALERLRARRQERSRESHTDIEVAGSGGDVVVRYRPLTASAYMRLSVLFVPSSRGMAEVDDEAELNTMLDALVRSCAGVYERDASGEFVPADPAAVPPVGFDERLAERMGLVSRSARGVALEFLGEEVQVAEHAAGLFGFAMRANVDLEESLMGESSGRMS